VRFYDILYLESEFSTFYIFSRILPHSCLFSELLAYFATVTSPCSYLIAASIWQTAHMFGKYFGDFCKHHRQSKSKIELINKVPVKHTGGV